MDQQTLWVVLWIVNAVDGSVVNWQYLACRQVDWLPQFINQNVATVAPYTASVASLAHMIGIWTMVVITVDRYIAVCLPSEVQLRTIRRAKFAVAYIAVLSLVCCLPLFFDWKTAEGKLGAFRCDNSRPKSVIIANPVPVDGSWWIIVHQIVCDCLIRTLIPFVMLVSLSSRMVVRLRRMTRQFRSPHIRRRRRHHSPKSGIKTINWRKNMMATLVAVVGLFAVCQLPRMILRVIILLVQTSAGLQLNQQVLQQAVNVASLLLVINATANFFVYCFVGTSFRRGLIRLFSFARRTRKSSSVTTDRKDELALESSAKTVKLCDQK